MENTNNKKSENCHISLMQGDHEYLITFEKYINRKPRKQQQQKDQKINKIPPPKKTNARIHECKYDLHGKRSLKIYYIY